MLDDFVLEPRDVNPFLIIQEGPPHKDLPFFGSEWSFLYGKSLTEITRVLCRQIDPHLLHANLSGLLYDIVTYKLKVLGTFGGRVVLDQME